MNKFLVICDRIPPEHSASGRFIYEIAKEMSKTVECYLVCLSSERNGDDTYLNVHKVTDRYGHYQEIICRSINKKRLYKLFYKIKYNLYYRYISLRGLNDVGSHKSKIIKECSKLIRETGIDTLISVSNPFETQEIAFEIKKKYPKIKWYPYMMDSNRNNAVKIGSREEEMTLFKSAEKIFIVPALLNDMSFCKDFKEKTEVVDLPIVPSKVKKSNRKDGKLVFIYAGMFYENIRNPELLLRLFTKLPEDYELHLYFAGCRETVEKYKEVLGDRLKLNGFVAHDVLEEKISCSDFVVSIGNTVLNQVASKVYDMVAFGKPVLNFYQNEDDISIDHLAKYPICLNVPYSDTAETVSGVIKWSIDNKGKFLSYDEATAELQDKRLSSVAERIIDIIKRGQIK